MTSSEVINAVVNYVKDKNAQYAILIDGAWGSGKTYLYENYLVRAIDSIERGKNERKRNVYISLYGISTLNSLAKQLVTDYLLCAKAKVRKNLPKSFKSLMGIIGVVGNAFSFSMGPFSINFSHTIDKIVNNIDIRDIVICFDDWERCTIPINEFLGFVNNLVEHCNCKVIILADEKNIGKIYANTNVEEKYLTVLMGNRRVVEFIEDDEKKRGRQKGLGNNLNEEITVEELKKLNERLYSENYIYKDIKEKVIGKTIFYAPKLQNAIEELINGNEIDKGIIQDGKYREFLINHTDKIVGAFYETENCNMRIIKMWLLSFKKIYDIAAKFYADNKYFEDILDEFLHYSIWVLGVLKKNKKIVSVSEHGSHDYVYFEGHEYIHILRYSFIDAWICREVWNDGDLLQACQSVIKRKEREDIANPKRIHSTGVELSILKEWELMEDEEVKASLARLEEEIKANKYAYYDYSNILARLLLLQKVGLYDGDIEYIKDLMVESIKKDKDVQEDDFPKDFQDKKLKEEYDKLYIPIAEVRKKRNCEIDKEHYEEADIYRSADAFYEHCHEREDYYCTHKSFVTYLDLEKLNELINTSDNEGIYTIRRAFNKVYFMSNLIDFYEADIEGLKKIRNNIHDEKIVRQGGITRKLALNSFSEAIKKYLLLLGVDVEEAK